VRHFASKHGRSVAIGFASAGLAHFSVSIFIWFSVIYGGMFGRLGWPHILGQCASALVLFAAFFIALWLAWRGVKVSITIMFVAFFLAVTCFVFDVSHHRYQIAAWNTDGVSHMYLTWWWY
jgi:hypothetical protein